MNIPSTVQKNCKACGDLITVRVADHKRGWGNFCDKACSAAYKCGMRPQDVNKYHAKCQGGFGWAADRLQHFDIMGYVSGIPPKAPSIESQLGTTPKIKKKKHSPKKETACHDCGKDSYGYKYCNYCDTHHAGLDAIEEGWDGHKVWK